MEIILLVVLALAAILLITGYFVYRYMMIRPKPRPLPTVDDDVSETRRWGILHYDEQMDWLRRWGWEDVSIRNWQGGRMAGYLFLAKQPTARTALCIHGYHCDGLREYLYIAQMYLEKLGMNVLIVDDYAHGQSEGRRIGFGWNDRRDCLQWSDWLQNRFGPGCEVLLQGISMGGNTVLNAACDPALPACVRWVVEDCGFSSASQEIRYMMKTGFHAPAFPLYHISSLYNRLFNHYFFSQNSPIDHIQNCRVPMLFVHGTADVTVPYTMGRALYGACPAPKLCLWREGIGHADCYLSDPEAYCEAVRGLLLLTQ